jgi:predicted transcriptional regulator
VREVYSKLRGNKDIAYTTVSTTLERLFEKDYLTRTEKTGRGGTRYVYKVKNVQSKMAKMFVDEFLGMFGKKGVSALHKELDKYQ